MSMVVTCDTLATEEDSVVHERSLYPARGWARRSGRLESRPSLEEEQVRPVLASWRGDLASEDGDGRPARAGMGQRDRVCPLREDRARNAIGDGHVREPYRAQGSRGLEVLGHLGVADEWSPLPQAGAPS